MDLTLFMSKEAKASIDRMHAERVEEFRVHHNWDTSYSACVRTYYGNERDVFMANNGELITWVGAEAVMIFLIWKLVKLNRKLKIIKL